MPVNRKRVVIRVKGKLFFECELCGKFTKTLIEGYCAPCYEFNSKAEAYAKWLEARGLLPPIETDPKAYYPRG